MDALNRAKVAWESTACERVLPLRQLVFRIGNPAGFGEPTRSSRDRDLYQLVDSGMPSANPEGFWMPTVTRSWNSSSVRAPA